MKETVKIEASHSTNYDKMLHISYHRHLYNLIEEQDMAVLHLDEELMKEWNAAIVAEERLINQTRSEELTDKMKKIDSERMSLFSYLITAINNAARFWSDPLKQEAGQHLSYIVSNYHGTTRKGNAAKSISLQALVMDLRHSIEAKMVETLSLTEVVDRMNEKNEEYLAVAMQRISKRSVNPLVNSSLLRSMTDALTQRVLDLCYASQLFTTNPAELEQIENTISLVNILTERVRAIYRRRLSTRQNRQSRRVRVSDIRGAIAIAHLPVGQSYSVVDIAQCVLAEGLSAGERIELPVPTGIYTVKAGNLSATVEVRGEER